MGNACCGKFDLTEGQIKRKEEFLRTPIRHIDFAKIHADEIIDGFSGMSFSSREVALAAEIYAEMLRDEDCSIWLTLAGSTGAAGLLRVYADLVRYNMVDVVVATGASIVDMDFFEALGFRHYAGSQFADDSELRNLRIDRIYDTFINEDDLRVCDETIQKIAASLPAGVYSSRKFIRRMGEFLYKRPTHNHGSLVELAYRNGVPIFCPAFSDSSAGFGLVMQRRKYPGHKIVIDSVADFDELTEVKFRSEQTGLFMIGGGVPKNFAQDTVVCAEVIGHEAPMHRYAVQITVADARDGACSSSTLKEAGSWGKVEAKREQMVFAEASLVVPLIAAYCQKFTKYRKPRRLSEIFHLLDSV